MVTIFKNIKETSTPFYRSVDVVLDRIKQGVNKDLILQIRSESDKSKRNILKKDLPAICFSGKFPKRSDNALEEYSSLICLDFDGYSSNEEMLEWKEAMMSDEYVMSVFVSPSGNGLKVIIKVPNDYTNHKRYFDALRDYFDVEFFDVTSKNISRVCYESYDPDIYINNESKVWETLSNLEYKPIDKSDTKLLIPITDDNKVIDILVKWWKKKFPMVEGYRNNNAFILASALNEYGINRSLAEYVLGQYAGEGFSMNEIKTTVSSAYKNIVAHGTKYYEDEVKTSKIRVKINKGESIEDEVRDIDKEIVDSVVKSIENDGNVTKFWHVSEKGSITLIHYLFKEFLESKGFYKFSQHGSSKYAFVKVTNNLIKTASEEEIKDYVLKYLQGLSDFSVYNFFADKTRFFKEDFLSMLDTVNVHFVQDTKYFSYIYFRNCAVKVSAETVEKVDYIDLDGYVWNDQIIDRDFEYCDVTNCDFKKFISNIAGDNQGRIDSIHSTIGFLLSSYKDPGFCPSVILNDEIITDNPEGGTGKGLFVQGLSMMKKVSMIDGKSFSFDSPFAYQTINTDTQLVSFDDVKKNFNFERLFSAITEGLTIERKNKTAIRIPFKFSPKIIITTNYAIRGRGNSFARRKWELEFKQFYNKDFTPVDEFGKRFFDEWNEDEWCSFDNYMINNLSSYFRTGLVSAEFKNVEIRRLGQETCHEFIEFVGLVEGSEASSKIVYNKRIFMDELYMEFIDLNQDFAPKAKHTISRVQFYKWLKSFGVYQEYRGTIRNFESSRSNQGQWIMYNDKTKEDAKEESAQEIPGLEF